MGDAVTLLLMAVMLAVGILVGWLLRSDYERGSARKKRGPGVPKDWAALAKPDLGRSKGS